MESKAFSQEIIDRYSEEEVKVVAEQMRQAIEVKDRRHYFKWYNACFVGTDMVQWLLSNGHANNVEEALEVGNYFMEQNVFHHVVRDHTFKNQKLFYRFEVDEKDRGHSIEGESWQKVLPEGDGQKLIFPDEIESMLGELTDWHLKSPGPHHIHEMLLDPFNCETLDNCRPIKWVDPTITTKYDMIAIGGGAGGLVTAIGVAISGGKAALIERNVMGGDCLNTGCVPSKAFIKSAKIAHSCKEADKFGINISGEIKVDFGKVMQRVREIRAQISEADSVYKLIKKYGVDVFLGHAKFTSENEIEVNGIKLSFSKACIATGGSPYVPDIEGLKDFPYFVSENVFNLTEQPKNLIIIGAGPIGCELGQSFQRLGTQVTMVSRDSHFLPREDPDAASFLEQQMMNDGIKIWLKSNPAKLIVHKNPGKAWTPDAEIELQIEHDGQTISIFGDSILLAAGRRPNVHGMGLEEAKIEFDEVKGVTINDNCRTTNKSVYAVGDVCSPYQFTHNSDQMARIVVRNALFFGKLKYSKVDMAWCNYTDPEIAHVGKYPKELDEAGIKYDTYVANFNRNDRAICESVDGMAKIHCKQGSEEILGCTLVGGPAGDMICSVSSAMMNKVGLSTLGTSIYPYPTFAEVFKNLSGQYNLKKLTPGTKTLLRTVLDVKR